jgi:hypothetical protein
MEDYQLNPDYFAADGSLLPGAASDTPSGTGSNAGFLSSLFSSGGNVLTQALKNQAMGTQAAQQAKLAKAQATNSSSTMKIVIIAVAGLAVVGIIFAFLKRGR